MDFSSNIIGEDAERLTVIFGLKIQVNNEKISYIGFPVRNLEKYVGRILLNNCNIAVYDVYSIIALFSQVWEYPF
jgi:DNA mismatch repair ATPase MutS